jgi:hypothetical protein
MFENVDSSLRSAKEPVAELPPLVRLVDQVPLLETLFEKFIFAPPPTVSRSDVSISESIQIAELRS